jgi:hypothetical protein
MGWCSIFGTLFLSVLGVDFLRIIDMQKCRGSQPKFEQKNPCCWPWLTSSL